MGLMGGGPCSFQRLDQIDRRLHPVRTDGVAGIPRLRGGRLVPAFRRRDAFDTSVAGGLAGIDQLFVPGGFDRVTRGIRDDAMAIIGGQGGCHFVEALAEVALHGGEQQLMPSPQPAAETFFSWASATPAARRCLRASDSDSCVGQPPPC
jgi:hypothetical protein